MRDRDFNNKMDCVETEFMPFAYDEETKEHEAIFIERFPNSEGVKQSSKYDLVMSSEG